MSPRHGPSSGDRKVLTSKYIREAVQAGQSSLRIAGADPSPSLLDSIAAYIELLLRWNRKLNLTAITDPREIVTRNFAESLLAAPWLTADAGRLCDVGSGAGFPGLALKLVLPAWQVVLLEPTAKKAAFLSEAARTLGLKDVQAERARWEETDWPAASFDAITSRAVGGHTEMAAWAMNQLRPGGKLVFWLGAEDAEDLGRRSPFSWELSPVPGSRERVLAVATRSAV